MDAQHTNQQSQKQLHNVKLHIATTHVYRMTTFSNLLALSI